MYRIGKRFRFEAGHHLPSLPEGHKCKRPHGHSYVVEVILQSPDVDLDGFVVDYAEMDAFKRWLDESIDHRDLNQLVHFPTTAENLAQWFYGKADAIIAPNKMSVRVAAVRVKETESTFAEFIP